MQVLRVDQRVIALRQFKAPYNDNIINEGEEGTVYAVGPAWDLEPTVVQVGVNTDSGKEVTVPMIRSHLYWKSL